MILSKLAGKSGNLLIESNALRSKSMQKRKKLENEEKNLSGLPKKS